MAVQVEIIFGYGNGQIVLNGWDAETLDIKNSVSSKGKTASFNANIPAGQPMPELESLCIIREITSSGFKHKFTGRYEQQAIEYTLGPWNFQFSINSLIDYTHRGEVEEYSEENTLTGHIQAALAETGASDESDTGLKLLDLATPIPGDDGVPFQFDFPLGNLEAFLDAILTGPRKARWTIEPEPFTDYVNKTSGAYGVIKILFAGVTSSKNIPSKLDLLEPDAHCDDPSYIKYDGNPKETRKPPLVSRVIVNGRKGAKLTEDDVLEID